MNQNFAERDRKSKSIDIFEQRVKNKKNDDKKKKKTIYQEHEEIDKIL